MGNRAHLVHCTETSRFYGTAYSQVTKCSYAFFPGRCSTVELNSAGLRAGRPLLQSAPFHLKFQVHWGPGVKSAISGEGRAPPESGAPVRIRLPNAASHSFTQAGRSDRRNSLPTRGLNPDRPAPHSTNGTTSNTAVNVRHHSGHSLSPHQSLPQSDPTGRRPRAGLN
jgi:hypothetical protein